MEFVKADDERRKALMRQALPNAYPTFFDGTFDISRATAGQFDEHLRQRYEAKGSTVDKVASFFIAAADYSDVALSQLVKDRKPTSSSPLSGKSKKQRKQVQEQGGGAGDVVLPPPPQPMSDKALEYKLVDLLKEPDIQEAERSAVWALVQYLTRKGI